MACFVEVQRVGFQVVFNLFGKSASLDDLIARKKYAQALVVMREQFRRNSPDAPARQRFADLLILADRQTEAIPILLGLADEHLRFGFLEKAKEALTRLEQLETVSRHPGPYPSISTFSTPSRTEDIRRSRRSPST